MAERFRTLVTQLSAEFTSKKQLLEKQERELLEERERVQREIRTMQKLEVSNKDLIQLNVGGRLFTTKRGCLRVVEGSVLDLMFSGRWEDRVDRDKNGHVFLDFDPDLFTIILRYLVSIHTYGMAAEHLEIRPVSKYLEEEFRLMLGHLGLMELIQPVVEFKWSTAFKSPSVTLEAEGALALANGDHALRHFVVSDDVWISGVFKFHIKIELLEEWAMIGVIKESVDIDFLDDTCVKEGVYGFGSEKEVFVNGTECSKQGYPGRHFETGDELDLILDCRYSTLTLKAAIKGIDVEYKIPELDGSRWKLLLATYFGCSMVAVKSA